MSSGQCAVDNGQWEEPPTDLVLLNDEVHVWRASLDQPAACVQRLAQTLSADERLKAERFYFERDRLHFIVGRGLLRTILGRYLGLEPSRLHFAYSAYGKPSLDPKGFENPLGLALCYFDWAQYRFNLAHSHGLALYAITREREIGVDIEYVRPIAKADQIVEQFFSARERAVFCTLSASQKPEAFFNCWTRKEAYIKAIGDGLTQPLDQFDVSLAPGKPAKLLSAAGDLQASRRWFIHALTPAPGYVAAVAVKGHGYLQPSGWQFKYWDFEPSQKLYDRWDPMQACPLKTPEHVRPACL